MKIKLDENLGERGRKLLIDEGHDVCTVFAQGLQSSTDMQVLEACQREGRALVTLDLDFSNPLQFPPKTQAGIAVLRTPKNATQYELLLTLETLAKGLRSNRIEGKLWIVEIGRIREYDNQG